MIRNGNESNSITVCLNKLSFLAFHDGVCSTFRYKFRLNSGIKLFILVG